LGAFFEAQSGHLEAGFDYSDISISPTYHDFGNVNIGGTSTAQSFTITNNGTADLVISSILFAGGDNTMFGLATDTCPSLTPTIAQGESCAITAVFTPTSEGIKSTTLEITSNDPDTPLVSVLLNGTGADFVVCGDAGGNGYVDIFDALLVAEYDAGLKLSSGVPGFDYCDVDCNGNVDIFDALKIAEYDAGLIDELECCQL